MSSAMHLVIHPEPSDEEIAVIVTALRKGRAAVAKPKAVDLSNWTLAARRETHRADNGWLPGGWQRAARFGE